MCPMRQTVRKALVGRFLQSRQRISRKPAPALSFRPWPFSFGRGANLQTGYAPWFAPFPLLTIPHRPALAGLSARWPTPSGANRKPCKSCFLARRWRNAALAPPVLDYRQEGPLSPGACMRARATTIGADHHHRHNHHRLGPDVTVVMVVTVAAYCLHRRKHRYALGTIITQGA